MFTKLLICLVFAGATLISSGNAAAASFRIEAQGNSILVNKAGGIGQWTFNDYGFVAKLNDIYDAAQNLEFTGTIAGDAIVAAAENTRTNKVAVAVKHAVPLISGDYYELGVSSVFVINRTSGTRTQVRAPELGLPLRADGSSRSFQGISSIGYGTDGSLNVAVFLQSQAAVVSFNPDLSFKSCNDTTLPPVGDWMLLCGEHSVRRQ